MKNYDYLIVGSGLFGATFACEATRAGKKCLVIDKRSHVGGNVYCEQVEGITVHRYGAHIFHTDDKKIWEYMTSFADFNDYRHRPVANYKGEIYSLPFNMKTFCALFKGVSTPDEARAAIDSEREKAADGDNLEARAVKLVGRTVYEKLIKGYTEKQWGKPCRELPPSIIERIPVRFTFDDSYFSDKYQGVPIGGYTPIIEKMLEKSDVILDCDFLTAGRKFADRAKKIIYTGAIDGYFSYRLGALSYRSLEFKSEVLPVPDFQSNAVVNYTDGETPFTRIIEHSHFEGIKGDKTVITREYPRAFEVGGEPFYPVNDEKNDELYQKYLALAEGQNVIFGGRLGQYKYLDMDETVSAALALAKRELG